MQMESIQVNENRGSRDALPGQLFPPECNDSLEPDGCVDFLGVPDITPRIGTELQAEIPPVAELFKYMSRSGVSKDAETCQEDFLLGLPIPVTWANLRCGKSSKNFMKIRGLCGKCGTRNENSNDSQRCSGDDGCCFLVPGLSKEPWSELEKSGFLLGLYIFEKNFVEVRRFVETKGMGAILSFYYGEFYGSAEHRRWSECLKTKGKKFVHGQRIFSGWRQQELLSRILLRASEECRTALLEVSKTFGDDKMPLKDYVSSLKTMVGMKILVDSVGIGTGRRDLTGTALEASKSHHRVPLRPEIPSGKTCSSLTTAEISNFLSGGYRLSKARSSDLFWEAVWPRLLARGWTSEQPNDHGYLAGFKSSLVFLVPGVNKFSRRKLVKGDHYFDSVADVLNKVAKEPHIIELESEQEAGEGKKKECNLMTEMIVVEADENEDEDRPLKQRHNYLKPRTPNRGGDFVKFTVIDTSLPDRQVREVRGLPSQISNMKTMSKAFKKAAEDNASVRTGNDAETINTIMHNASVACNAGVKITTSSGFLGGLVPKAHPSRKDASKVFPSCKMDLHGKKESRKVPNSFSGPKLKRTSGDHVAPTPKKCRKLTTCSREEASDAVSRSWTIKKSEKAMPSCSSGVHELTGNVSSGVGSYQDKLSSASSSRGSPYDTVDCGTYRNAMHAPSEPSLGNHQMEMLIDLNVPPPVPPDFESGIFIADLQKEHGDQRNKLDDSPLPDFSSVEVKSEPVTEQMCEQPSDINPRRYSTRNRPPTARALEALANGYLTVNRKKKKSEESSGTEGPVSRRSKRHHSTLGLTESTCSFGGSLMEETENFGGSNVSNNLQGLARGNEESASRK